MLNLFGRPKNSDNAPAKDPQEEIQNMAIQISAQEKSCNILRDEVRSLKAEASKYYKLSRKTGDSNYNTAQRTLQRAKQREKALFSAEGMIQTLETQKYALEAAISTSANFAVMQKGSAALQRENKKLDIDKVNNIMEGMEQQLEHLDEVSDLLGAPLGNKVQMDDAEFMAEMEQIALDEEEDMVGGSLPTSLEGHGHAQESVFNLPSAGTRVPMPSVPKVSDEEELAALVAEMN
jgi:hypothetical protein